MYPAAFEYHTPGSVQEALGLLGKLDDAKILAGGHSLVPMMKLRLAQPKHLIDLRKVPGLNTIKEDGAMIAVRREPAGQSDVCGRPTYSAGAAPWGRCGQALVQVWSRHRRRGRTFWWQHS